MSRKYDKFKVALNKYKKATRAPFKEDTEDEVQSEPVVGVKEAMPRENFKSLDNLVQAIDGGYDDLLFYLQHWEGGYNLAEEDLEGLDDAQKAKLSASLPKLYSVFKKNIPYPICGSVLENFDIKVPTEAILNLDLNVILDEYFGTCYHPSRATSRYSGNFTKEVGNKVREAVPLENFIERYIKDSPTALSIATVDDFIDLYGLQPVKNWWRTVDEETIRQLRDDTTIDMLYDGLVEKFGGGLID